MHTAITHVQHRIHNPILCLAACQNLLFQYCNVYNIDDSVQFLIVYLSQPYSNCVYEHKLTCHVLVTFASSYSVHLS